MGPDRFVYNLEVLFSILAIYVLAEVVALSLAGWVERLAEKRQVNAFR
jgi:hypothetical protein